MCTREEGSQDGPAPVAKLYNTRRAIGKTGILGCGYGMGAARALEYMMTYPELEPQIEEGVIDLLFAKRLVDGYREKYRMIPKFWHDLEATFVYVTRYGQERMLRGLHLSRQGTTTVLRLPSSRCLFYHGAALDSSGHISYQAGPTREKLWGGTLTENVVQAMSRDVLAEAILYIEDHGFRVAHHVYDSVVVVAHKDQDTLAFACVSEALTRVPTWAEGWPMGVETTIGRRYD